MKSINQVAKNLRNAVIDTIHIAEELNVDAEMLETVRLEVIYKILDALPDGQTLDAPFLKLNNSSSVLH